jgi:hypothetical protein
MVACFVSFGCEIIPEDLFTYCFHELKCEHRQCVVSFSLSKWRLPSLAAVSMLTVAVVAALRLHPRH